MARRRVRGLSSIVAEPQEGKESPAEALARIDRTLREATVRFGLGELSSSTYHALRQRLENERAEVEARLFEEGESVG